MILQYTIPYFVKKWGQYGKEHCSVEKKFCVLPPGYSGISKNPFTVVGGGAAILYGGLRPETSEGASVGQLKQCLDSNSTCKGPEAETCFICGRNTKEASIAETASGRRITTGKEIREARETRQE